jgi:hypothetical protein
MARASSLKPKQSAPHVDKRPWLVVYLCLHTAQKPPVLYDTSVRNMKVKILSYHAVAAWRWDMPEDDDCGICRVQFDGTCPKCKFPGDDCPISKYFPGVTVNIVLT